MSDYVAQVYPAPEEINHGDAVHFKPENAITDAGLGYSGQAPDTLDSRLQFDDGIFAGAGFPGIVPDPSVEANKFLRDDGTWAVATASVDESLDCDWTGTYTFSDILYSDTYWEDLQVPVSSVKVQGASHTPDWGAFLTTLQILWFDAGTMEQVFFVAQLPHTYKEGTNIEAHVHWTPSINGVQANHTVRWGLEYSWANIGATFPNTPTIIYGSAHMPSEQLVTNRHYTNSLGQITGTGKTISSMLICRLFRDATDNGADTYTGDAGLLEFDFHYEVDRPGSIAAYHVK